MYYLYNLYKNSYNLFVKYVYDYKCKLLKIKLSSLYCFNTTGGKFTKSKGHFHGSRLFGSGAFATFHVSGIRQQHAAVHPA